MSRTLLKRRATQQKQRWMLLVHLILHLHVIVHKTHIYCLKNDAYYASFPILNQKAHHDQESAPMMNEQDPTHTSDDATEAALDDYRPLDAASARNCP